MYCNGTGVYCTVHYIHTHLAVSVAKLFAVKLALSTTPLNRACQLRMYVTYNTVPAALTAGVALSDGDRIRHANAVSDYSYYRGSDIRYAFMYQDLLRNHKSPSPGLSSDSSLPSDGDLGTTYQLVCWIHPDVVSEAVGLQVSKGSSTRHSINESSFRFRRTDAAAGPEMPALATPVVGEEVRRPTLIGSMRSYLINFFVSSG
jgi:hypothetical protein